MENLEHELWIVQAINAAFGPIVTAFLRAIGRPVPDPAHVIPNYLAVILLIIVALTALSLFVRSRLSVDKPGKLQIIMEDGLAGLNGMLDEWVGPDGPKVSAACRHDRPLHLGLQSERTRAGPHGADEQRQCDAWLRDQRVGLLPHRRRPRAGPGEVPEALRGPAGYPWCWRRSCS